ncbi:50S ribosomal protein L15 [Spirochaeta cellobiosiphila]|uniref:50S ribosomal protein L15 n=1 Tax=Spirochaeta cellobiosiphila TaxID=504483 RepID=UPI0004274086|nr:50S ribosomal protein L15 [Spirochaeta cellobiosiphila]
MAQFEIRAPKGATKKKKIVGRGRATGVGKTSGRGSNGQNARSGGKVRPGFEGGQMPLYRRLARRGFSNARFKKEYVVINLIDLQNRFKSGDKVNLDTLKKVGLIKNSVTDVKLLGNGEIKKKLTVELDRISTSAKEAILAAGGTVSEKTEKE